MKIGAKIFGERDRAFLENVIDKIDFIETMAIGSQNYDFLKNYGKEIVLHAEHQQFGINPPDRLKYKRNLESIEFALRLADRLKTCKIVCHPGIISNKTCSKETAIGFFRRIDDERILIENLPLLNYKGRSIDALCAVPEETEDFLEKSGKKMCFDISHSIISAIIKKAADYNEFIIPYLELKPAHFHFSDILLEKRRDHLHFGDGNLNVEYYKKILPENAKITLETRNNPAKLISDIKLFKSSLEISSHQYMDANHPCNS